MSRKYKYFPRFRTEYFRNVASSIRQSLLILLFLIIQCTNNHKQGTPDSKQETQANIGDTSFASSGSSLKQPGTILLETRPKPQNIKIPEIEGGSYLYTYFDGDTITIRFKPPQFIPLRIVSRTSEGVEEPDQSAAAHGLFTSYTTDKGLILDAIASSFCDKMGNLWFGTYGGGVCRYDGKSFTNFTNAQGLANNNVLSIAEDKTGNLWFGTDAGVSCYDGKSFINFTNIQGLTSNSIRSIFLDKKGNLWFGADEDGVSRYDGKSFTNFTTSQGLTNNSVRCIIEDRIGDLWFGTAGGGVSCYDGKSFTNFTTSQGLANNSVRCVTEDINGNLWFGTDGDGVSRYDGKSFTNFTTSQGLANNSIWSIMADKAGNIWFGTFGDGVSCFDGKSFTNFNTSQGLINNSVVSISEDKTGNLWFGTYTGGISRYDGKSFINFTTDQGLSNNIVLSISEDRKGNLWFGTYGSGVSRYDGKAFTNYSTSQGLANNSVRSIVVDKTENLWFGTDGGGVSRYDGKSFTNFTTAQGLASNIVLCIIEDKKGNLWFGTYGGVSRYDGISFTNFTTSEGLSSNSVWSIMEDKTGNLWFGTDGGGVSRYDGKSFTNFTMDQGLPNNSIWSIVEDDNGTLWFGTDGGGVSRYDGKSFTSFTTKDGLPDNVITQIVTSRDKIIFGSNLGVAALSYFTTTIPGTNNKSIVLSQNNLENSEIENYKPVFEIYNSSTGYPVRDVNIGQNAMYKDSKGFIWVATGSDKTALARINYDAILKNSQPPVVILQNLKVNNENISWYNLKTYGSEDADPNSQDSLANINEEIITFGSTLEDMVRVDMYRKFGDIKFGGISKFYPLPENLELPYRHNDITIEFTAIEPARPDLVKYQYILEGYDDNWSPSTSRDNASFGNIFEGTYTFKLKACSPDGIWSDPITYTFKVRPPWYRTWWMYTIYVLVFVSALYLVYRWRVAKLKKENLILEEKVKLRTVQLQQANDLVTIQKEHIEEIHKEVTDSINYAKRLQNSAFPNQELLQNYFSDFFILFKPKDLVSGDFYWFAKVENQIVITVADCTGHGVPGAFMSMLGISLLKEIVIKENVIQPDDILDRLRKEIIKALGQTGASGEQKDGMDISLCSINMDTLTMQWSGANNPCLIIREGIIDELKADKMPIAIYDKMDKFTLHEKKLQKDDIIYLAGDGYQDQFGGPKNKKFMSKRFTELLLSISIKPMVEQKEILDRTIEEWKNGYDTKCQQTDDITVIGLKIS